MSGPPVGRLEKSLGPVHAPEIARAHQITMIRMRYAKLLQAVGLSEPELEVLLPVLCDLEPAHSNQSVSLREMSEHERAQFLDEVGKVIGRARAEQVLRGRQQLPVRMQLGIVKSQLDALGAPLSKQQENELVARLSASGASLMPRLPKPGDPPPVDFLRKWRQEQHQHFLSAAEGVLTPQQIQRFSEVQAMNDAMSVMRTH